MSLVVRFLSGARRGAEIQLEGAELRVGEDPACDVFLDPRQDPAVCGRRATIQLKDDGWYVRSTGEYPVLLNQATLVDERRIRSGDVLRMSETGPDLLITIERHVAKRPAATEPIRHVVPQPAQTAEHPPAHNVGLSPQSVTDRATARAAPRRWLIPVASGLAAIGLLAAALWFLSSWPNRSDRALSDPKSRLQFSVTSPQVVDEGQELAVQIAVAAGTGPQYRLSYAVTGPTPQGSSFDAVGGWFRWTPSEDQGPANYPLSVRVRVENDDDLSAETTLWIQVREVNSAPSIEPASEQALAAGQELTVALRVNDPDRPPNRCLFRIESGPEWARIDAATGILRLQPPATENGAFNVRVEVTDDGQPPLRGDTVVKLDVRGDPWQRVVDESRDSLWLVQVEAQGPKGAYCWPFATGCAVDRHTLLLSAREVLQIAAWQRQGQRVWVECPARQLRFSVQECRVHREFALLAGTPGDWIYANLGLLIVDGELPTTVPLASAAEQQIEEGLPIVCYGYLHDGSKITRFDRFQAQPCRGEVYLISPSPVLPDRLKLLEIQAAIPENAYGSPILTQQGTLIGVYGNPNPGTAGVKDLHYATAVDSAAIRSWIEGRQDDWVAPPPIPPAADAQQRTPTKQDALP